MKEILTAVLLVLPVLPATTAAQEWKENRHSLTLSIGALPATQDLEAIDGLFSSDYYYDWSVHDIYHPGSGSYLGSLRTSGSLSLTYGYDILRWLRLDASATYTGFYRKVFSKEGNGQISNVSRHYLYVMSGLDFVWVRRRVVEFYSGFELGMGHIFTKDRWHGTGRYYHNDDWKYYGPAYFVGGQLTLVGVKIGGAKWYGTAECGYGMKGIFSAGFGYRF